MPTIALTKCLLLIAAGFTAVLSGSPAQADSDDGGRPTEARAMPTRHDIGLAYLRLERAYARHRPEDAQLRQRINRHADEAVSHFFSLRLARAVATMDQVSDQLEPEPATADLAALRPWLNSLRIELNRPVYPDDAAGIEIRIDQLYEVELPRAVELGVLAVPTDRRAADAAELVMGTMTVEPGRGDVQLRISHDRASAIPIGSYTLALRIADPVNERHTLTVQRGGFSRVERSLFIERREMRALLDAMSWRDESIATDARAVADRIDILTDRPSRRRAAEFQMDMSLLLAQLREELERLEAEAPPFAGHPGTYWRTFRSASSNMAAWIHVPEVAAKRDDPPTPDAAPPPRADGDESLPLIIALHGAGGDEAMFMFAHGGGMLRTLADERGFVLASVQTPALLRDPSLLDVLIQAMARDHHVDIRRVFLVGHSMGGFAISRLTRESSDRFAGAAMIAGMHDIGRVEDSPPLRLYIAAEDRIVPLSRLEPVAARARAQGTPLSIEIRRGIGHLLVVSDVLESAVDWLLDLPARGNDQAEPPTAS
ncbi:MAG: hypothetical protein JJU36_12235 [Phycisphaeraceae bacterium]|nr:hypothetical protein [Phycisphaeraceae bacterium]